MQSKQFLTVKKNVYGDSEICLDKESLLAELPSIIKCYKIDFSRSLYNRSNVPFHTVLAIAPIFMLSDGGCEVYSEQVTPLPSDANLEHYLIQLAESLYSEIPTPSHRDSITSWFKHFTSKREFFFIQQDMVYYGCAVGGRGYSDLINREQSCTRISSDAIVAKSTELLANYVTNHFSVVANHFDSYNIRLSNREHVKGFAKQFLADNVEFKMLASEFESQLAEIDRMMAELQSKRRELGNEYGIKTRRLVRGRLDEMEVDNQYNQEQVKVLSKRINGLPLESWLL